ncbi:MAG: alpha/beta hydrolase [Acidimicrobiia bacterium]|nr:alpha/beta hydrolase [Acidimicrobiia bacterium]
MAAKIIDRGEGPPLVVVPGVQGRWEWMAPAIDALASRCRVITFSLADEPSSGWPRGGCGLDAYAEQVGEAMTRLGLRAAVIGGVSFGGLAAGAFAARYPERTRALVLVSALPPDWTLSRRARRYLRAPWLFAPLFWLDAARRAYPEIRTATPDLRLRIRTALRYALLVIRHPASPARMAGRVRALAAAVAPRFRLPSVPALIVTGERTLDRVVPVDDTLRYLALLPRAEARVLERTGHLGLITRPEAFADLLAPFVHAHGVEAGEEMRRRA